jgi:hypothetical protein
MDGLFPTLLKNVKQQAVTEFLHMKMKLPSEFAGSYWLFVVKIL